MGMYPRLSIRKGCWSMTNGSEVEGVVGGFGVSEMNENGGI